MGQNFHLIIQFLKILGKKEFLFQQLVNGVPLIPL